MIRRLGAVILALCLPVAALAQAVKVTSGDHPDFTRIVIDYGNPVDWKVGRTTDGYELRLPKDGTSYDLTSVFDQIGKERLATIWADPISGALHFGVACACFAIPFEFRPGTVVIDIRNGPPPKGSSFEQALDGGTAPDLIERRRVRPTRRSQAAGPVQTYDWTASLTAPPADQIQPESAQVAPDTDAPAIDLAPLRQSLIEELSRGASQGIVDMAKPKTPIEVVAEDDNPSVEVREGEAPNLVLRQQGEKEPPLSAEGVSCIPDDKLDVADWAEDQPFAAQVAEALQNLTGEFDRPDPEAVKRATRFYLKFGFGAEARAILRAFPTEQEDAAIWQSMARILDGEADPAPIFAGMAACDTSAALWAILADPGVLSLGQVEKAAVLRGFSALPIHLRHQLGPTMVDRFLAMKDFATATALRDAVLRGTIDPGPEIEMMEAAIERTSGSPAASAARLEGLTAQSGPTSPEALTALVIQLAETGRSVSFEQVTAMEEYAKEREGSEDHARFHLALTLAYGASGDFDKAFALLPESPEAAPVLWQVLAASGKDTPLLDHAVLPTGEPLPPSAGGAATLIAQRLVTLGLGDQAARWLALAADVPKVLAARVALARGEADRALVLLEAEVSPAADDLRIEAHRMLGNEAAMAELYAARDMADAAWSAVSRMRDWDRLAADGPETWQTAASHLLGPGASAAEAPPAGTGAQTPVGPLERNQRLLDESVATRRAISTLLETIKSPDLVMP